MATFDTRLKKLRKEKGITQTEFADAVDVTKSTVSIWERGIRKPDFQTMERVAGFFDTSLAYLIGDSESRSITEFNDEEAAVWVADEEAELFTEMAKKYVRLSPQMREVVNATILAAYKQDLQNNLLAPADEFRVTISETFSHRQRLDDEES